MITKLFLNKGRISLPDIDTDFDVGRRGEVVDYLISKYGKDQVAQIGTSGTMKSRLAVRDTARALGVDPATIDAYGKLIPEEARGGQGANAVTLSDCLHPDQKFAEAHKQELTVFKNAYDKDKVFQEVINRAYEIEGLPKSIGTHAAGVVLWDKPLTSFMPLMRTKDGIPATQWSDKQIEAAGAVKYDLLGLRTLTVIDDAVKSIKERTGLLIDWEETPEDDAKVFEMLSEGDTFGVFQLESSGMKGFTMEFKPNSIDDIAAVSSLFRPGPLDSGMVVAILEIRSGKSQPKYLIPELIPILESTESVLTYQEQTLSIAKSIAGYSLSEADLMRKIIGKKLPEEMAKQKDRFVSGGVANGHPKEVMLQLFEMIERFSDYGFCKAHAIAYSILSYRTAYLKRHYPADFYAANMSSWMDDLDRLKPYLADAKTHGIKILPPDINVSGINFTPVDNKTIRFGLMGIKGCGESAVLDLIEKRTKGPFANLIDFCKRIDPSSVKKNNLVALAQAGALDSVEDLNRVELESYIPGVMDAVRGEQMAERNAQVTMFETLFAGKKDLGVVVSKPRLPEDSRERLERERAVLGFYVSSSPFDKYLKLQRMRSLDCIANIQIPDLYVNLLVQVAEITIKNSKNGSFAILKLEDDTGNISAKAWSRTLDKYQGELQVGNFILVSGKTNLYRGLDLIIDSVTMADTELNRISNSIKLRRLSFEDGQKISCLSKGNKPIDLEIKPFRFRLGLFDFSSEIGVLNG